MQSKDTYCFNLSKLIKNKKLHDFGNNPFINIKNIQPCEYSALSIENRCIVFEKHSIYSNLSELNYDIQIFLDMMVFNGEHMKTAIEYFTYIQTFYIWPIQFAISILLSNKFLVYKPLQTPYFGKLTWISKIRHDPISEYHGYIVYANKPGKMKIPTNVFQCKDGSYIAETSICDGIRDCTEGTDENQCYCNDVSDMHHVTCKYICDNISQICPCSAYYFTCASSFICIPYVKVCDGYKDCLQGEDELCRNQSGRKFENAKHLSIAVFTCLKSNVTIPAFLVDDLIPDCPKTFEDEMQYYNLMTNPFPNHNCCGTNQELPCIPGHSHCFPLSKLCVYELQTKTTTLKHCRNGAHLYNCTHFQCSEYFKCPLSYCIPFELICNGKWECPHGNDEINCHTFSCPNLFKCKNQTKCIHFSKLCNMNKDCMFGDDESWCTKKVYLSCNF